MPRNAHQESSHREMEAALSDAFSITVGWGLAQWMLSGRREGSGDPEGLGPWLAGLRRLLSKGAEHERSRELEAGEDLTGSAILKGLDAFFGVLEAEAKRLKLSLPASEPTPLRL